jgi:hypothetical protein
VVNFGFGNYKSGAWLSPATAPVDPRTFSVASGYFDVMGFKGSKRFSARTRTADAVNEWASSNGCKLYWNNEGKLAMKPLDHRPLLRYVPNDWWITDEDELRSFVGPTTNQTGIKDEVEISYLYNSAQNKYVQKLRVKDLDVQEDTSDSRSLAWSKSAL